MRHCEWQACPLEPQAFPSCGVYREAGSQSRRPQTSLPRGATASATSSCPQGTNFLNVEETKVLAAFLCVR